MSEKPVIIVEKPSEEGGISPLALLLGLGLAFGVFVFIRARQKGVSVIDYIKGMTQGQFGGGGR